jgi:hypothetical protein
MSLLAELYELIRDEDCDECLIEGEWVHVDENDEILNERAISAFRREGKKMTRKFRCAAGEKKGRLVADPKTCVKRKSMARVLAGRKIAAEHKGLRIRKSKISLKTNTSRMVRKANKRLKRQSQSRKPKTVK